MIHLQTIGNKALAALASHQQTAMMILPNPDIRILSLKEVRRLDHLRARGFQTRDRLA